MAKCLNCGKKGLFFKVNAFGLCNDVRDPTKITSL